MLILSCALPQYRIWLPFIVVIFYILSVCPTFIAKRFSNNSSSGTNPCFEMSIFITVGIVISSFALPIVLARSNMIHWGACNLTLFGNVIIYLTILGYYLFYDVENNTSGGAF